MMAATPAEESIVSLVVRSIKASHVVISYQMLGPDGEVGPWDMRDGRNVSVSVGPGGFHVLGGGLDVAIPLAEVERVEIDPYGTRFGLAAQTTVPTLVPERGVLMVRIDAKTFGRPKKKELAAFTAQVQRAVEEHRVPREVQELQYLYANRVSFGASLLEEFQEINAVYGMLRDLGSDADQAMVDAEKTKNAAGMYQSAIHKYHEPHLNRDWFDENRPDRA